MLVLKLRFDEEKILGIIKKIIKGLVTPPVKNNKDLHENGYLLARANLMNKMLK